MTNNSKILLSLFAGAAAGTALSLLFAPKNGKDIRKNISDAAQDLNDKIMKKAEELVNKADETLERGKSYIKQQL